MTEPKPVRGRPRRFDRQVALRRAMETFWALGYEGASIAELTRAMGLASPSLYAAFGSKDELFRQAAALYETEIGAELAEAIAAARTARAAVEAFVMTSAGMMARPGRPPGCMIVLSAVGSRAMAEPTCVALRARRTSVAGMLTARLQAGVDAGELPRGLDVAAIAAFYVTVQQGMSIQAIDGASPQTLERIGTAAMAAWDRLAGTSNVAAATP